MNTLVDIILPNYNSEKYIDETLKSIINQSLKNWKLYIVDDASADSSLEKIEKYNSDNRIDIIKLNENKGPGHCRNQALKLCKSKYISFIDSDDVWSTEKLEEQINFMSKSNIKFSYTNFLSFKVKKEDKVFQEKKYLPQKFDYESFTKSTSLCTSSMIIEREVIGDLRFLEKGICEDYFFKCEILKKCGEAKIYEKHLTFYRYRSKSLQSNRIKNIITIWNINKNFNKMTLIKNFISIFFISINSIKRHGFK